jgi:CheY-like chemotaxis protein
MNSHIWIKVVGFSDAERNSLNTLFRVSEGRTPCYALWTPDVQVHPHVALIDSDSYEASLELASPRFSKKIKIVAVGDKPPKRAWRSMPRPVDWSNLVQQLDHEFAPPSAEIDFDLDLDFNLDGGPELVDAPMATASLLVGLEREDRLYLRARMALANMVDVDEVPSAQEARICLSRRHYDLVVVSLDMTEVNPWEFVRSIKDTLNAPRAVMVLTRHSTPDVLNKAEKMCCAGLIEVPFQPKQVVRLLQKV